MSAILTLATSFINVNQKEVRTMFNRKFSFGSLLAVVLGLGLFAGLAQAQDWSAVGSHSVQVETGYSYSDLAGTGQGLRSYSAGVQANIGWLGTFVVSANEVSQADAANNGFKLTAPGFTVTYANGFHFGDLGAVGGLSYSRISGTAASLTGAESTATVTNLKLSENTYTVFSELNYSLFDGVVKPFVGGSYTVGQVTAEAAVVTVQNEGGWSGFAQTVGLAPHVVTGQAGFYVQPVENLSIKLGYEHSTDQQAYQTNGGFVTVALKL